MDNHEHNFHAKEAQIHQVNVKKIGVEDDQQLEYYGGFKARITSLSLERYLPPHIVAIGLMTTLPQDIMKPL